jgi:Flp pilus assembly protein TadG
MNVRQVRGQSLIEFALLLPLLLIIVFGIIDFSIGLYDKAIVTNASREGARTGIVYRYPALTTSGLQSTVNTAVQGYCSSYLITFGAASTPAVTVSGGTVSGVAASGQTLSVTVSYNYAYSVISSFIPGMTNPTLTATSVMRME